VHQKGEAKSGDKGEATKCKGGGGEGAKGGQREAKGEQRTGKGANGGPGVERGGQRGRLRVTKSCCGGGEPSPTLVCSCMLVPPPRVELRLWTAWLSCTGVPSGWG